MLGPGPGVVAEAGVAEGRETRARPACSRVVASAALSEADGARRPGLKAGGGVVFREAGGSLGAGAQH